MDTREVTAEFTEEEIDAFIEKAWQLIEEGYLNMGDRWLIREACRRAGIARERVERALCNPMPRLQ